jgi:hypothetical protein
MQDEHTPDPRRNEPAEPDHLTEPAAQSAEQPRAPRADELPERMQEVAGRLGRMLGRSVQRARAAGEEAARDARPEVERLARSARSAAETARPHVEQAGRSAIQYVRDHNDEIKRAARVGAELTAHQVLPMRLRPIVAAVEADRWRRAPYRDDRTDPEAHSADASSGPTPDRQQP